MVKKFQYAGENILTYNDFGKENGFPILVQHGSIASIKDIGFFEELSKFTRIICIAREIILFLILWQKRRLNY